MKFCTECGNKLSEGAKFCESCGTRVAGGNDNATYGEEEDEGLLNEEAQLEAEFDDDDYDETGEGDDSDDEG